MMRSKRRSIEQLVKTKKQEVSKPIRGTSSGFSSESRGSESRSTYHSYDGWGYSCGESRGESRW